MGDKPESTVINFRNRPITHKSGPYSRKTGKQNKGKRPGVGSSSPVRSSVWAGQVGTLVLVDAPLLTPYCSLSSVLRRREIGISWVWECWSGCAVDQALKRLLGGGDWEALDWQKQSKGRIQVPVLGQGHHTAGFCLGETSMHLCMPHQHGTINKGLI